MSKSWVEDLILESIHEAQSDNGGIQFSVATFNILAEAYCSKRSHQNLPPTYADVAFYPLKRRSLLRQILTKLSSMFDLICLQELDELLLNDIVGHMSDLGYGWIWCKRGGTPCASNDVDGEMIRKINQRLQTRSSKPDGCGTFYLKSKWFVRSLDVVNFDDLADENRNLRNSERRRSRREIHSLSGIVSSYRRTNTALIVELELQGEVVTKNLVLVNTHLYWHPGYEYVKLSQTHYLMLRVKEFINNNAQRECIPLICGDMNSKVNSAVYKYFVEGKMDARLVAPWSFHYDELEEQEELAKQMSELSMGADQDPVLFEDDDRQEIQRDSHYNIGKETNNIPIVDKNIAKTQEDVDSLEYNISPPTVKYLLDVTLNKFTRWLRILGQDAALETADEERMRTIDAKMYV
jgi:mRNA deadenylase 3'-5' endonuclease subunit Ccr4